MQYSNSDKLLLKQNKCPVLSKITLLNDSTVFTGDDYISDWEYKDFRYVPNNGFIGQFVERTLDGKLKNIPDNKIFENQEINLQLGIVDTSDNDSTTWYDYGNFLITKVQKEDTTGNYKFESADYTKKFNIAFNGDYTDTNYVKSFNDKIEDEETVTALWLAQYVCAQAGVVLHTTNFTNYDFVISSNQYDSDETLRKVMQDIGKLAYSWVRVAEDNKVHIDFTPKATSSVDTYDTLTTDEYYTSKKSDLTFGSVNKVVIGMSAIEGERMYETSQDYTPETECAIYVFDNNLTNTDELRALALNGCDRLFGVTYTPITIDTIGHPWLEGDELIKLTNVDNEVIYTYPFNRTIKYAGYIKGTLSSETSTKQNSKYEYKSDIVSSVKKTAIIVDKQEQTITALAKDVDENTSNISTLTISVDGIESRVESIETTEVTAVTNEYAVNTSPTNPPAQSSSSWSTTKPTRGTGEYIWARIKTTYKSGNVEYSDPVNTTGDKGDPGQGGKGISSINNYYKTTSTQDEPTASSITSTTIPTLDDTDNKYLWQKTVTNYTSGNPDTAVSLIGVYGDTGDQGPQGQTGATGPQGPAGNDGNGIQSVTYYYATTTTQSQPSASSVTSTTIPTMSETNKYLWQKEVIKYTKSGVADKVTVALIAIYGDKGNKGDTGETGATGNGISSIAYYYKATSTQSAPSASSVTSTTIPTLDGTTNKYLWQKEVINYTTGDPKTTVALIGVYGDKGQQGETGATGNGISSITYYYATSTTQTAPSASSITSTTIPTLSATNKYLWQKEVIAYTNLTSKTSVLLIAVYGDKGDKGNAGDDGASIDTITEYYAVSSSNTTAPSSWTTDVSSITLTATNKYLWNYTRITYTEGKEPTGSSGDAKVIGVYGDKGQKGDTGSTGPQGPTGPAGEDGDDGRGIVSITEYYLATSASSGVTRSTSGWTTTIQTMTSTNKYLWNYEKIVYTSGTTTEYVEPMIIGVYGLKGDPGTAGKGIQSVTELYYVSNSSTAPSKPSAHVTTSSLTTYNAWNLQCPPYTTTYKYFYTCSEVLYTDNTYGWTNVTQNQGLAIANQNAYTANTTATTANNTANSASSTATTALNTVNNLQIGGRNYFKKISTNSSYANGSFDNNYEYTLNDYQNTGGFTQFGNLSVPMSEFVGEEIVMTFEMISPNGAATLNVIYNSNGNPRYLITNSTLDSNSLTTEWKKITAKFTVIDNGSDKSEGPSNKLEVYVPSKKGCKIRKVKVEKGNKATDWSPAPEDAESNTAPFILGTQTAATGSWTGNAPFEKLLDGQQIAYWLPYNGSGNASLNLTLSNGTTTGAIACYYSGASRLTTHYPAGNVIHLTYRVNANVGGTNYTGWWADANYDTNNYDRIRLNNSIKMDQQYGANSRLVAKGSNDLYTIIKSGSSFTIDSPILMLGSNINPITTGTNNYLMYSGINITNNLSYMCDVATETITSSTKGYAGTGITGTSTTATVFSGSGVSSAAVGDLYINTSTYYLYKCTLAGNASTAKWVYVKSLYTVAGKRWYYGNKITGTSTTGTVFSGSGVSSAAVGDQYFNTSTGYYYECTLAGNASTAKWVYKGVLVTVNKILYLRGTLEDNVFTVDKVPFTTTEPTTDDGLYYISLGNAYGVNAYGLFPEHPIYKYVNGEFKVLSQVAYEAQETANSINSALSSYVTTETYTAGLANTAEELKSWSRGELVTTSDFGTYSQYMEGQLSQKAGITEISSTATQIVNDAMSGISETISNVEETFTFDTNGLKIARGGNSIYLQLQNDELAFRTDNSDGGKKAYMTSNAFVLNQLSELRLGNFGFVVRANGSVDFKKVK